VYQYYDLTRPFSSNHESQWVETQRYEYTKLQRANVGAAENTGGKNGDTCDGDTSDAAAATIVSCAGAAAMASVSDTARPTNPRLTEERIRRLESIGFEWKVKNKMKRYYDRKWDGTANTHFIHHQYFVLGF